MLCAFHFLPLGKNEKRMAFIKHSIKKEKR
jgi:hypothetical protein